MAEKDFGPSALRTLGIDRRVFWVLLVFSLLLPTFGWAQPPVATDATWQQRHAEAKKSAEPGAQVALLSQGFLGMPYVEAPLRGSSSQSECLINDLTRIDCFTLLDFVETLRRAPNLMDFDQQLLKVRYRNGELSYQTRNHFFSAWGEANHPHLRDLTGEIAGAQAVTLNKTLNLKQNGDRWLEGLPVQEIQLRYLPTPALDEATQALLQSGDYLGIVSPLAGLDVSHTGILIRKDGILYLRHASSRPETRKVLDEPLIPYLKGKLGLLVFRPQ